ncbi:MAG: hypothetical protein ACOCXP_01065 [Candidatus Dojkabacteria bacterium]
MRKWHKLLIFSFAFTGFSFSILVVVAALHFSNSKMEEKLSDFNKEHIALKPTSELTVNFVSAAETKTEEFSFELSNFSEHDYTLELAGNSYIYLPAGSSKVIWLEIPVMYTKSDSNTEVEISTTIGNSGLLGTKEKSIIKNISIDTQLLQEEEIITSRLNLSPENLEIAPESESELDFSLDLTNLTDFDLSAAAVYIYLVGSDNSAEVQPLLTDKISLTSNQSESFNYSFKFNLPPADLILGGDKEYKVKAKIEGVIKNRSIEKEIISNNSVRILANE